LRRVEAPGKEQVEKFDYQVSKTGKYVLGTTLYERDLATGLETMIDLTRWHSFNGQLYRMLDCAYESREPLKPAFPTGYIFAPEQQPDPVGSMIKPTFFMDHLFNPQVDRALNSPDNVTISETDDGLWYLEYSNPDGTCPKFLNIHVDPAQDFMITRVQGDWDGRRDFVKEIAYGKTAEGFYYPVNGTFATGGKAPKRMEVTAFELNAPEGDYTVEFPVGTLIRDYTKGNPAQYRWGQEGR
jgi:hypothetical protein